MGGLTSPPPRSLVFLKKLNIYFFILWVFFLALPKNSDALTRFTHFKLHLPSPPLIEFRVRH